MACKPLPCLAATCFGASTIASMAKRLEPHHAFASLATFLETASWYRRLMKTDCLARKTATSNGLPIGCNALIHQEAVTIMPAHTFVIRRARRLMPRLKTARLTRLTYIGQATERLSMDNCKCFGLGFIMEHKT